MTDSKQNTAEPGGRRRRLSAPERRRQIIAAAQEVFIRSSLSGARTREIAAEAGVNEATLFAHFESKEALFEAAVLEPLREAVSEQVAIARARAPQDQPARDASLQAHDRFLRTMLKSYPLLVTALFSDRAAGEEMYRKHIFPMIRTLADITRERAGEDRLKHVDVELMTLMGFGVHLMVVMDHHFRGTEMDVEKTAAAITAMFDHGLRPD